jgi:hypothetical protein
MSIQKYIIKYHLFFRISKYYDETCISSYFQYSYLWFTHYKKIKNNLLDKLFYSYTINDKECTIIFKVI